MRHKYGMGARSLMTSATEPAGGRRKNYHCVQALRAVAASLVVVHHSITMWMHGIMHQPGTPRWPNGAAGVDIFFVISGFVMAISLPGLAGKRNKASIFLWRRSTRIVPLYWAAITLTIVEIELGPGSGVTRALTPWRIAASYLFIPSRDGTGQMFPIMAVGWTLNYEALFYLLFAAALALKVSPLAFLTPCLTALALLGMERTAGWPDITSLASPIVIEFLFGMILAHFAARRKLPGNACGLALLIGGFLVLMLMPQLPWNLGILPWGLPAAAMVTGAVAIEDAWGGRLPQWLLEAGDASYALYLSHTFVLPYLIIGIASLGVTGAASLAASILLGLAISFPAALLIHRYLEKPLINSFKKGRKKEEIELVESPIAPVSVAEV